MPRKFAIAISGSRGWSPGSATWGSRGAAGQARTIIHGGSACQRRPSLAPRQRRAAAERTLNQWAQHANCNEGKTRRAANSAPSPKALNQVHVIGPHVLGEMARLRKRQESRHTRPKKTSAHSRAESKHRCRRFSCTGRSRDVAPACNGFSPSHKPVAVPEPATPCPKLGPSPWRRSARRRRTGPRQGSWPPGRRATSSACAAPPTRTRPCTG